MRIKNLPSIESMNGSQDALVIEQTDGSEDKSRKVSPAQIKQYVLGNSIDDIYSVMGQMGAKNLIPYPYYRPNHYEINGITYDVSSDGVITMQTGTSTAEADYHMWHRSNADTSFHLDKGTYILSGCDTNAPGGVSLIINGKAKNGNDKNVATQNSRYPDGVEFTIDDTFDLDRFGVLIYCSSGVTISSALTFKPMIRFVSDINDDTYQPYAKTNRQLTEVIGDLSQTGLTGDSVAEQLGDASGQIAGINAALATKLSLVESVSTDTGDSVTFTKQLELDKNYLVVMSAATTYTGRRARMSLIVFGNNNTINEVYIGDSFTITNNNRILTITSDGIRYGITASILKL